MTPFPEAEIMTIKRLEVALRKMDYKLLKDGAYKLHEKFHSGHKFEYLDLLRDILIEVKNNPAMPFDVKDLLAPTIEDILSSNQIIDNNYNNEKNEQIIEQESQRETKINAFDAFSPQKPQIQPARFFTQSPFSAEPFKGFNAPHQEATVTPEYEEPEMHQDQIQATQEQPQEPKENMHEIQEQYYQEVTKETLNEFSQKTEEPQETITPDIQIKQEIQEEVKEDIKIEHPKEKKSVAILYCQDSSNDKIKNIIKLREILKNTRDKNASIDDLLVLISEITTQADTNIIELQGILEQLTNKGNPTNLITNSQSAMFYELLEALHTTYSYYKNEDNNKLNIIPLYGASNMFVCEECKEKYLDKSYGAKPLVVECPKCKHPMYPDFYAAIENEQINLNHYSQALVNLANSRVWLLIHPSYCDKNFSNLLINALKVSSQVEEVFILEKDINTKEMYKNVILQIKSDIKVNIQGNALEDFFNLI